jgi:hypothetical protein
MTDKEAIDIATPQTDTIQLLHNHGPSLNQHTESTALDQKR